MLATVLFALAFAFDHITGPCCSAQSGPMDDSSVSALTALDNAVEAVAARVTPAVVNVAVTSKVSPDDQGRRAVATVTGGQGLGGINPQDLPPGFRQFFFGPGGMGGMQGDEAATSV